MKARTRLAATSALFLVAGLAQAQVTQVMTRWDFNQAGFSTTNPAAALSNGTTAASLLGGVVGSSVSQTANGGSSDPNSGSAWSATTFPAAAVGSGTAGFEFRTSTVGYTNVFFEFDIRASNSASEWYEVQVSTNGGATYTPVAQYQQNPEVPGPGGFSTDNFVRNANGPRATPAVHGADGSSTLALGAAANNNPDVRVRFVSIFAPTTTAYASNTGGTTAYAPSGTVRLDMVEFWGTTTAPVPPSSSLTAASPNAVCDSTGGNLNVTVTAASGANPVSSTITVSADLTQLGGGNNVSLLDLGGGIFNLAYAIPTGLTPGIKTVAIKTKDNDGPSGAERSSTLNINVGIGNCANNAASNVVISQVYGGGGANGTFDRDFIELFNRSASSQTLTGYSLQYAAAANPLSIKLDLPTITIPAGGYYLIQTEASTITPAPTNPITPTPNFVGGGTPGSINMGNAAGKIALVSSQTLQTSFTSASIVDLVGYGATANNFEGAGSAQGPSNFTSSLFRKLNGCQDSNENFNDFELNTAAPRNAASTANTCAVVCVADVDDGSGTGTTDGGVGIEDLLYYLALFEAGTIDADVDDGSGTGVQDGGVGIEDLLYYLFRFESGC